MGGRKKGEDLRDFVSALQGGKIMQASAEPSKTVPERHMAHGVPDLTWPGLAWPDPVWSGLAWPYGGDHRQTDRPVTPSACGFHM